MESKVDQEIIKIVKSLGYNLKYVPKWKGGKVDHRGKTIYIGLKAEHKNSIVFHEIGHIIQKSDAEKYSFDRELYRNVILGKWITRGEGEYFLGYEKEAWDLGRTIASSIGMTISNEVEKYAMGNWENLIKRITTKEEI